MILTEAPLRFVLKVFSVLCRGRAQRRLLGPNCSSEFRQYDGAFGGRSPTHSTGTFIQDFRVGYNFREKIGNWHVVKPKMKLLPSSFWDVKKKLSASV